MRFLGLLVAFTAAIFASVAHAAAIPLSLPSNVAQVGATFVARPGVAFSGAAFNSGLTTQVAGKLITVPAAWRMAANAGQVALAAVRLNPGWLAAGMIASWLLEYGLTYNDGVFQKQVSAGWPGERTCVDAAGGNQGDCDTRNSMYPGLVWVRAPDLLEQCILMATVSWNFTARGYDCSGAPAPSEYVPAQESDFASVTGLTDAAANYLVDKGVAIPLSPQVNPATQVVPLSDPYIDPVTGKRWQDVAHVTPSPTDPKKADLQVSKQEVDPNGDPLVDPETNQPLAPQEIEDPCLENPTRLGCVPIGEAPDPEELETDEKGVASENGK